ncbi:MAG: hypothetical protein HY314_03880 [Acidobacteria bacterium]|nr:hypothetical protein [Acidobacteriota bacterium]
MTKQELLDRIWEGTLYAIAHIHLGNTYFQLGPTKSVAIDESREGWLIPIRVHSRDSRIIRDLTA